MSAAPNAQVRSAMGLPAAVAGLLLNGRALRPAGDGVWSALPADVPQRHHYDRRAAAYDAVVGSALYNRMMWSASPRAYSAFAAQAAGSNDGLLLDVGCGSLVFTANLYARPRRPIVLVDESLGMLHAARARLIRVAGSMPNQVVLVQASLLDLPFRPACFPTVLCMGLCHLFDDVKGMVGRLMNATAPGGQLFVSSLVAETRVGTRYLSLLHRIKEVAAPRTQAELLRQLQAGGGGRLNSMRVERTGSMAFVNAHVVE